MNDIMTEQDWNEVDLTSRNLISCYLCSLSSCTGIGESHGNCCWDLSCRINGKTTSIEIKDRSFPHSRFNDVFVEDIKQKCTALNYSFACSLAVAVFNDNVLCISNLHSKQAKHFKKWCPETSLVKGASHQYIQKDCCSLPQTIKISFESGEDGKWKFKKMK